MKFLKIDKHTTLSDLGDIVGERNVDAVLNINNIPRTVKVGKVAIERAESLTGTTDWQTKLNILNTMVGDSDIYEKAALGTESDWNCLSQLNTFPDYFRIPETIEVAMSDLILGNGESVPSDVHEKCEYSLKSNISHEIDPSIFLEYSLASYGSFGMISDLAPEGEKNPFEWFKLPWGKISLYSSILDDKKDFPVYPEEISDGHSASFEQMPSMLYEYEPWYVYKNSGPRQNTYTFHMHRDMWTGDHRDGLANELIRFCEANCFPEYTGSSVIFPTVTLLLNGNKLITGIMNSCKVEWSGPLGLDDFYLEFKLVLEITEVSDTPLNYSTIMQKGLIT